MSDPNEKDETTEPSFDPSATMVFPRPEAAKPQPVPDDVWHMSLEVIGGPMDGLKGRTPSPVFTIGRGAGNDLSLSLDPMVSTSHARVVREGRHYWLEDLGSRNGTFIGDHRLEERALISPGTTFTAGCTQLEFMPR